jgi:hypothetical protein
MRFKENHKMALDEVLLTMPGIKGGKAFGYPAYKVNGKVFAFVCGDGIALKLPEKRVIEMIENNDHAKPFQPVEGVYWREWVAIAPPTTDTYQAYIPLFEESIQFVVD